MKCQVKRSERQTNKVAGLNVDNPGTVNTMWVDVWVTRTCNGSFWSSESLSTYCRDL